MPKKQELFSIDLKDEILIEIRKIEALSLEVCKKLSKHIGKTITWENACNMARELKVNFPSITGNLECDAHIAFMSATRPNAKFIGIRTQEESKVQEVTKENFSKFKIDDIIIYEFERKDDEPILYYTHKKDEWIDTPEFSGSVYKIDPDMLNTLTLTTY